MQIVCYLLAFVAGTVGNILVIIVIATNKNLHTATNVFLLNLSVADLLYLQSIPFAIVTLVKQKWIFGVLMCKSYW